jgi:SAM-dependent methyltransferase
MSIFSRIRCWTKWNRLGMSLRSRGVLGTAHHFLNRAAERRFDALHNVETTTKVPPHALGVETWGHANEYTPVPARGLSRVLVQLPIEYPKWDFVDIGAGKGRALLVASQFAFRGIIGVELSADLVRVAERNITTFRDRNQRCFDLKVVCGDAQEYTPSSTRVVLYLFDPFNDVAAMERVLCNVQNWLESGNHMLYILYWHPRLAKPLEQCPALTLIRATAEYRVYSGGSKSLPN